MGALCHCSLPSLCFPFTKSRHFGRLSFTVDILPLPYKFVFCKDSFLRFLYLSSSFLLFILCLSPNFTRTNPPYKFVFCKDSFLRFLYSSSSFLIFILRPSPNFTRTNPPYKYIFLAAPVFLFLFLSSIDYTKTHAHLPAITTIMADQQDPNRPKRPPISLPNQPNQLIDDNSGFTPYYMTDEEARKFPGRSTPYLSNMLNHPPEEFPSPRNKFPGSDPIMDARKGVCGILFCKLECCSYADEYGGAGW